MEELEVFLSAHSFIEKVALVLNSSEESSIKRVASFFSYTNIEECHIVFVEPFSDLRYFEVMLGHTLDADSISLPPKLFFSTLRDFKKPDGDWALCPVGIEAKYINQFIDLCPKWIIGSIIESKIGAFKIWNTAREFCDNILLKTVREDKHPIVMDWGENKESDIELSVVFPVYNVSEYLDKCISTVTHWEAPYIEFIFVDDGSTDDSPKIIKRWMETDHRIKLFQKENGGCASARQYGLERAIGRYVGFVDPDDFIDSNMFRRLLDKALSGSFDISLCGYNEYYNNTKKTRIAEDYITDTFVDGCFDPVEISTLITYSRVAIWRGIYRREFLLENNIGFYTDIRRFDDLPFKVETFAFAKSVVMTNEYLYYYRLEREGQDVAADDERLFVHFDIFKYLGESIGSTYNQRLIDNLQMCKIQTHRYALSKIKSEYRDEYIRRAKEDLNSLSSYERTCKIAEIMIGKEALEEYKRIVK